MLSLKTFLPLLPLLSLLPSPTTAFWKGFNLGATLPSGACKSTSDWTTDFHTLQSLPGYFSSARLYASSDCNTLAAAVPAALATSTTLLVGIWTQDAAHFAAEKAALAAAIRTHGTAWILAVSVGSEDLYRADTDAHTLAAQIDDVRGMLRGLGAGDKQVGHVDTWTVWVKGENEAVIRACDFVGTDGYPYYQDAAVGDGYAVFWESVRAVREVVDRVKPGTWVWITETGWPVSGPTRGGAVAGRGEAQAYWKAVACSAFERAHTFWFTLRDGGSVPSFGVVDEGFGPVYDLGC